jgi:hypothetical protein
VWSRLTRPSAIGSGVCSNVRTHASYGKDPLVRSCSDLVDAASTLDPNCGWLLRTFQGERWTPVQHQTFNSPQHRFSAERVAVAALARDELGKQVVEFALDRNKNQKEREQKKSGEKSTD